MSTKEEANEIPPKYTKIYMLTTLTEDEEKSFLEAMSAPDEDRQLLWMTPQLVHWTSDVDRSVEQDLLRLWKEHRGPNPHGAADRVQVFADRQCVEDGGTIVVDQDWLTLITGPEASEQTIKLAEERGIKLPTKYAHYWTEPDWFFMDTDELWIDRGLSWARFPGVEWKSTVANLEIANMGFNELADGFGDGTKTIMNPEWDPEPFFEKVKEMVEEIKRDELDTGA